jgi:hypothetical protein
VVVASQRTGGSGQSLFSLDPGTYDAEVEVPAGYALPPGAAKRQGGLIIRSGHATFTGFDLTGDGA